jgi:hypothetical protein
MTPVSIVKAFRPIDDIDSCVIPGGLGLSVHAFNFERLEEALDHGALSPQLALRLMDGVMAYCLANLRYFLLAYWLPRSVCMIRPASGRRC